MSAEQTVYRLPPNNLGQIGGSSLPPISKPTYAATVSVDPFSHNTVEIDGVNSVSATCTVNAASGGNFGQEFSLILKDTGGVTYTLGTNFKTAGGTLNPGTGKVIVVFFKSDGTSFFEVARGSAVTAP